MPVRIGKPKGVTGLIDEIEGPSFSSTVGAILHGVNISKTKSVLSFDKSRGNMGNIISKFR